jgi:hypothetical protein
MLLPLIGAGLGGYTAYQKSGGNLGATLLGAGAGALVPGGLRMAGTALAGTPVGAAGLAALTKGISQLGGKLGATQIGKEAIKRGLIPQGPLNLGPAGVGALTAGAGTLLLGAPNFAGNVAAGLVPAASRGAGGAANLAVSASQPGQVTYDAGGAVPQTPYRTTPYDSLAVADPSDAIGGTRLNELLMQDVQLAGIRKLMPELFNAAEARSKTEFQRQMAAAGIRQNIVTAANMLERSQQSAQQMGLNAAQQMGSALTSQYQYQ